MDTRIGSRRLNLRWPMPRWVQRRLPSYPLSLSPSLPPSIEPTVTASYEAWRAVAVGEKHDILTQRLASSPLLHSSSPSSLPPSLEDACALACVTALEEGGREGGREGSPPSRGGEGGRAEGHEEGKEGGSMEAREGMLEMGVVKGGEVYFLEETDIKAALRARQRWAEGMDEEQEGL